MNRSRRRRCCLVRWTSSMWNPRRGQSRTGDGYHTIRITWLSRLERVSAVHCQKMHNRTVSHPIATTSSLKEQEMPEKSFQSSSQPAGGSLVGAPTLIDFLHAVPPPLVVLLVRLAPLLAPLRYVAQILSWQTPWVDCWLLLAAWWAAVLFTDSALRSVTFMSP